MHMVTHARMHARQAQRDPGSRETNSGRGKRLPLHVASQRRELWHHMGSPLLTKQPRGHWRPPFTYTELLFYLFSSKFEVPSSIRVHCLEVCGGGFGKSRPFPAI